MRRFYYFPTTFFLMTTAHFRNKLLQWYADNDRPLPWKGEKNPYLIWLSEIILQQTRVEQGLPYFEKFKENYPTVKDLADASEDDVMKMWEGLGYYSRARNLHATAKNITYNLNGKFPDNYKNIIKLKGVGPYTAAAIASFAYDLPHAVVDGNVYRVLSRTFNISTPIDSTEGKKEFSTLAQECLAKDKPGIYNQAIMDFGATQCTPKNPNCSDCPLQTYCLAFQKNKITERPVKTKKIKKRQRFFTFLIIHAADKVLIQKRGAGDIWQGLYTFPLIETESTPKSQNELEAYPLWQDLVGNNYETNGVSKLYKRVLTHQNIKIQFREIRIAHFPEKHKELDFMAIPYIELKAYAFPRTIDLFLSEKFLTLELF